MKLDQLAYFAETARREHLGRAARVLAISPSAVSHAIASLEEELGHALFVREGKRIFLTLHGKRLAEGARKILGDVDALRDELRSEDVELTDRFRLAATHGLASRVLTPAWVDLQKDHPRVTAELFSLRTADVVQGVGRGE